MALDRSNVFVKYLPPELTDVGLHSLFEPFGDIVSSKVMIDHQTGASLGYGFVRFVDPTDAQIAISNMSGQKIANKTLLCKLSNTSPNTVTPEPSANLYIKPLLPTTTEEDLRSLFERFGPVNTCKVMMDKATNQSRQIGFDATVAMQKMNGFKWSDDEDVSPLVVKYAETDHQRASRKARVHQGGWSRTSLERVEREDRPRSPNYFSFSQMQAALYGIPYLPKGYQMSYVPMGYSYMMPLSPQQVPVNPLWRPQYLMNTPELINGEIGQH